MMCKKSRTFQIILLLIFFCLSGNVFAQTKTEKIDSFMRLCHEYRLFSGAVLVAESGSVIYKKAFGPANREWNIPNTVDTKYIIGSISKQFTAMLILQLVEEEKIRLDGKISDYLPDFPRDKGEKVTIHHLLCHASGIPNNLHFDNWYSELWQKEYTTTQLIELFYDLDLEFQPGSRWAYSNTGYYILAAIIEKVTGEQYEAVLKEKIFQPVNMNDSGYYDHYTILPKMASAYEYWNFRFTKSELNHPSSSKGAGSIYSTVEDLYKWDQALNTENLLSRKFLNLLFEPKMPLRRGAGYAYGWVVGEMHVDGLLKNIKYAEHSGAQPGYNGLVLRFPEDNHLIVFVNNTGHTDIRFIRNGLVNILYDQSAHVVKPLSLVLQPCKNLIEVQATLNEYQDNRSQYRIRRDAVNGVGFQFIQAGKSEMGLALLEFNAREFPQESWVFESLGEAYLMTGNKELAIINLKKTLELDPHNKYAMKKLKE